MQGQNRLICYRFLPMLGLLTLFNVGNVSADPVPPEVQAIFDNNCTSCHGNDGGLSLADAATSGAQLVDINATCNNAQKRVIAGDPDNSVLYKKITMTNPGCGGVMPPNGNLISVADRNTIRDWIIGIGPAAQFGLIEMQAATTMVQETDANVTLTVSRQLGAQGQVSVDYIVATVGADTATSPDDYIADAGTLVFADGEVTKTITVTLVDDDIFEGSEVFSVTLSNVVDGAVLGSQAQTKVTIQDNEIDNQPGTFFFSAVNYSAGEGDGTLNITILRSFGGGGMVTVEVNSTDGAATAGMDYTQVSETLQFAEGVQSAVFSISLLEDQEIENDEGFTLRLSNPTNGAILGSPQSVTVVIADNDQPDNGGGTGGGTGGNTGGGTGGGGTEQPVVTEEEFQAAGGLSFILPILLLMVLLVQRRKYIG